MIFDQYEHRRILLIMMFLLLSSILFVYPSFADAYSNIEQTSEISSYTDAAGDLNDEELQAEKDRIVEYNKKIFEEQQENFFMYRGEVATDEEYDSILDISPRRSMCYVDIPDINLYIGVSHGTRERDLKMQAGHMYGTSIPYGGENTNAVIAGHSGLTNAEIFTHLEDLEEGDYFYIHILDEIHAYKINKREIVLPDDEVPHLQIVPGEDRVTLYTCTPYGINTHRLILKGIRDTSKEYSGNWNNSSNVTAQKNMNAWIRAVILGCVPFCLLAGEAVYYGKYRKKRNEYIRKMHAQKESS